MVPRRMRCDLVARTIPEAGFLGQTSTQPPHKMQDVASAALPSNTVFNPAVQAALCLGNWPIPHRSRSHFGDACAAIQRQHRNRLPHHVGATPAACGMTLKHRNFNNGVGVLGAAQELVDAYRGALAIGPPLSDDEARPKTAVGLPRTTPFADVISRLRVLPPIPSPRGEISTPIVPCQRNWRFGAWPDAMMIGVAIPARSSFAVLVGRWG